MGADCCMETCPAPAGSFPIWSPSLILAAARSASWAACALSATAWRAPALAAPLLLGVCCDFGSRPTRDLLDLLIENPFMRHHDAHCVHCWAGAVESALHLVSGALLCDVRPPDSFRARPNTCWGRALHTTQDSEGELAGRFQANYRQARTLSAFPTSGQKTEQRRTIFSCSVTTWLVWHLQAGWSLRFLRCAHSRLSDASAAQEPNPQWLDSRPAMSDAVAALHGT